MTRCRRLHGPNIHECEGKSRRVFLGEECHAEAQGCARPQMTAARLLLTAVHGANLNANLSQPSHRPM